MRLLRTHIAKKPTAGFRLCLSTSQRGLLIVKFDFMVPSFRVHARFASDACASASKIGRRAAQQTYSSQVALPFLFVRSPPLFSLSLDLKCSPHSSPRSAPSEPQWCTAGRRMKKVLTRKPGLSPQVKAPPLPAAKPRPLLLFLTQGTRTK